MIEFTFGPPTVQRELRNRVDLLIGVVADLKLVVDGRVLYQEEDFPIVELRESMAKWLREGIDSGLDFEFESMESDEVGLVWFRRDPSGTGWRVGSIHQEYIETRLWSGDVVNRVISSYVDRVNAWLVSEFGVSRWNDLSV
jgi:hypothetical protein